METPLKTVPTDKTDPTSPNSSVVSNESEQHDSPNAKLLQEELPPCIQAVALRNGKQRFFVPSKENYFAGEKYEYVMVDNGCNSLLLPFRQNLVDKFLDDKFNWVISASKGTGAVKSLTLIITHGLGQMFDLGSLSLAGGEPLLQLRKLRFHLGLKAAEYLENHHKLSDISKAKINTFLQLQEVIRQEIAADMYGGVSADGESDDWKEKTERSHVLLGQSYLGKVISVQIETVLIMCTEYPELETVLKVGKLVETMREDLRKNFPEFDDLEDDDHDGDDEEEVEFEYADEPND